MEIKTIQSDRSVRLQYPYTFAPDEIYCPRCDMYFRSIQEYHDHLIIRQLKVPFLKSIKETSKERDVSLEVEFADTRNTKRMHWTETKKRYYDQNDLLNEVIDVRDQCRILKQRQLKGARRKTALQARNGVLIIDIMTSALVC